MKVEGRRKDILTFKNSTFSFHFFTSVALFSGL